MRWKALLLLISSILSGVIYRLYNLGDINHGRQRIELERSIKIETSRLRHLLHINHYIQDLHSTSKRLGNV